MLKRLALGLVIAGLIVLLPALGRAEILCRPHLWVLVVLGIVGSVCQPGYNPFKIATRRGDRGTGAQIIWSVYVTQFAAVLEATYLRYPRSVDWDLTANLALGGILLGLVLRTWAVKTLGEYFTMHIEVSADRRVVREGPYAFVRHPGYLGAFVTYMSTIALLHAWYSLAAAALILLFAFVRRIRHEEALLLATVGQQYAAYRRQVQGFLPGVW